MDEWPGRANEPDDQRGDRQGLPLSKPRKSQGSRPRLRNRLQLRKAPQGSTMENTFRGHLQCLDERPHTLHHQSASPHPGTKHLEPVWKVLESVESVVI